MNVVTVHLNLLPAIERQALLKKSWKSSNFELHAVPAQDFKKDPEGVWDMLNEGLTNWCGNIDTSLAYYTNRDRLINVLPATDAVGDYARLDEGMDDLNNTIIVSNVLVPADCDTLETS